MNSKIKILRIIDTLDPRHGGPQNAILSSSLALNKKGFKVDIVTSDNKKTNFLKSKSLKVFNIGYGIGTYGFNIKFFFWLITNRKKYDFFIIHGLWSFYTLVARFLLLIKLTVFK